MMVGADLWWPIVSEQCRHHPRKEVAASGPMGGVPKGDELAKLDTIEAQVLWILMDLMGSPPPWLSGDPRSRACWSRRGKAPQQPYRASPSLAVDEGGTSVCETVRKGSLMGTIRSDLV